MTNPPRTAVKRVDLRLQMATTRGVANSDTARQSGPSQAENNEDRLE